MVRSVHGDKEKWGFSEHVADDAPLREALCKVEQEGKEQEKKAEPQHLEKGASCYLECIKGAKIIERMKLETTGEPAPPPAASLQDPSMLQEDAAKPSSEILMQTPTLKA